MSRFDYVKYGIEAENLQAGFKLSFSCLSKEVDSNLKSPRAKALVQTKLEEAYMWVGKAIRDDQIERNEGRAELQEERKDS